MKWITLFHSVCHRKKVFRFPKSGFGWAEKAKTVLSVEVMVGMVTIHSQYIRVCRYEKRAINVEKQKYMDIYYIR